MPQGVIQQSEDWTLGEKVRKAKAAIQIAGLHIGWYLKRVSFRPPAQGRLINVRRLLLLDALRQF